MHRSDPSNNLCRRDPRLYSETLPFRVAGSPSSRTLARRQHAAISQIFRSTTVHPVSVADQRRRATFGLPDGGPAQVAAAAATDDSSDRPMTHRADSNENRSVLLFATKIVILGSD